MPNWLESQIDVRERLDTARLQRSYAELAASVSGPRRYGFLSFDDVEQTDGAVKSCLRYLGVEPGVAPTDVTDFNERVDWLCRPSATMYRTIRLEGAWYRKTFGAILGRLDTGESIALLPNNMGGYYYRDPETGRKVRVNKKTSARIDEDALFFYKPLPARKLGLRDLAVFVAGVLRRNDYQTAFIAAIAVTLIGLLPAWANQAAFGVVAPSGQAELILPIACLLVGVMLSSAIITACRNLVMARVASKVEVSTEAAIFMRVLALPSEVFRKYAPGNLASRVMMASLVTTQLSSLLFGTLLTAVLSISYVFQIAAYAPALAVPALCVVVVQAGATVLATFLTMRYERTAMEENSQLSGTVTSLLSGIQKIKLAGAEDRAFSKWASGYARYARASYNRPPLIQALPSVVTLAGLLGTVLIYNLAGETGVTYDNFMAFNVAFGQVTGAIMALAQSAGQAAQIRPMLDMISPILESVPEIDDEKPAVTSLTGPIEMSNVWFRYGEKSPYVVKGLSFKIHPGEYVALVGKSGSGKSTIMRLLLGFEKPERGGVFYGRYDVQKVDLRSLRSHIGTVMQDGRLFMGDIASNILIASSSTSLEDAWKAAEIAGIADDIRKMPMGMQTILTEGGGSISGGQRQRLMIARAVCGNKRILMFDEATSALDNKTQQHVSNALDSLNCTRVVVAHRLSTVRNCDRILVVDDGAIIEEGTYDELIAKDGYFAQLVERQRLDK